MITFDIHPNNLRGHTMFKTIQDVLKAPVVDLTDTQFDAFIAGRDAVHNGDECYSQFPDTKLCWEAGYYWETNRHNR